eukprot:scaffold192712_cov22-Prasinocladus_malaysianus.AAC.1
MLFASLLSTALKCKHVGFLLLAPQIATAQQNHHSPPCYAETQCLADLSLWVEASKTVHLATLKLLNGQLHRACNMHSLRSRLSHGHTCLLPVSPSKQFYGAFVLSP